MKSSDEGAMQMMNPRFDVSKGVMSPSPDLTGHQPNIFSSKKVGKEAQL